MTKKTFLDKLKGWRRDKDEKYAHAIMEKPEKSTILKCIQLPGVVLIMGRRRYGKTGLAHSIACAMHNTKGVPAVIHLPPSAPPEVRQKIQKILPPWMHVTTRKEEWPKKCVVIYDEASQTAHARRTQSGDAVELDNLIGISGQREQLLIFICHHSKKLDPNVVREVNRIIWKQPTYAYQLFERDELTDFTMKAFDYFALLRKGRPYNETVKRLMKRSNLVLDFDDFKFLTFENKLPSYWTEDLSTLFQDINKVGQRAPGY
ncbi:hypothetical protein LCGC14_0732770 [marine sediment metagenome]|uniref:Uncharacterized protein n=1 Tax=marine sediment metagenome TaxID=412755 RepID=A0A0F9TGA4_9ZZZZ